MEPLTILLTAGTSTAAALIGAFTGGWLTRRGEDRKWYREKQLDAYREYLRSYLTISIGFKRANADRRSFDYDWAAWGVSSMTAQMLSPQSLTMAIKDFHSEVDLCVSKMNRDTIDDPLDISELAKISERLELASETLISAMEKSLMGKRR